MKTYLVTGVAGFIASRVAEMLLDQGASVVAVDNLNDLYDVRLKQRRLGRLEGRSHFSFHRLDICDREELASLFGAHRFDAVINLAARPGVRKSLQDPVGYYETNVLGVIHLLELCKEWAVPKFVQASSSSVYGDSEQVPYREDQDTDHPLSPYAASKKAAESICQTYHTLYGLDVTIFRYFTVYGPAGRPDMSPFRFVQWISEGRPVTIYGDGHQSRDFTYVDDIARGTIAGLRPMGFEIINLGSDKPVMLKDLIGRIERAVGRAAILDYQERHPADVVTTWADVSKARLLLGWTPRYLIDDGVQKTVDWYRENRDWASTIDTGALAASHG